MASQSGNSASIGGASPGTIGSPSPNPKPAEPSSPSPQAGGAGDGSTGGNFTLTAPPYAPGPIPAQETPAHGTSTGVNTEG